MNKDHIIFLAGRITYKADRLLVKELQKHGLPGLASSHGEIIGSLLLRKGGLPMSELSLIIGKDKSTLTALVNKLIRRGYVKRTKDSGDNRINRIELTERGAQLKPVIKKISLKMRSMAYRDISEQERKLLYSLLERINKNL